MAPVPQIRQGAILSIHRVATTPPPVPPPAVAGRLTNGFDDPLRPPILADEADIPERPGPFVGPRTGPDAAVTDSASTSPQRPIENGFTVEYGRWMVAWSAWATKELRMQPARAAYAQLLDMRSAQLSDPEELEVVCGSGYLGWGRDDSLIQRHVFVQHVVIDLDDLDGSLTVRPTDPSAAWSVELDMLDSDIDVDDQWMEDFREAAADGDPATRSGRSPRTRDPARRSSRPYGTVRR